MVTTAKKWRIQIETITPARAKTLLESGRNRPISDKRVEEISALMREGWRPWMSTVSINRNGEMENGFHRCTASYVHDLPFETIVAYDVDPSFADYDAKGCIRHRTVVDLVGVETGEIHTKRVMSLARAMFKTALDADALPQSNRAAREADVARYYIDKAKPFVDEVADAFGFASAATSPWKNSWVAAPFGFSLRNDQAETRRAMDLLVNGDKPDSPSDPDNWMWLLRETLYRRGGVRGGAADAVDRYMLSDRALGFFIARRPCASYIRNVGVERLIRSW